MSNSQATTARQTSIAEQKLLMLIGTVTAEKSEFYYEILYICARQCGEYIDSQWFNAGQYLIDDIKLFILNIADKVTSFEVELLNEPQPYGYRNTVDTL
jgi:hypothetical protein